MSNAAIVKIIRQIAYLIELIEGEKDKSKSNTVFKVRAYKRTADIIENLSSNIEEIYKNEGLKGLTKIPSIGRSIAIKIEEYITTGKIKYFEELKKKTPINIEEFYTLEDIGI